MKFSIAALALAVTSASATPVGSADSVDDVVAGLKARTGAAYFHTGPDHVLRAVSADFEVMASTALTERQAAEWLAGFEQPASRRTDGVDERELLDKLEAHIRSSPVPDVFDVEARQTCSGSSCRADRCSSSCTCRCSGGQFEVCRCAN